MGTANGCDIGRVARGGEPVVDRCADPAALDRRLSGTVMAGDQQNDALAASNCLLEAPVDCAPCGVEVHPMEVEHSVGLD
jgi:hypothetical protein